jgi:transcription termination factor Rho
MAAELKSKHLAELHQLAADLGIEGYRMLRRDDLIERIDAAGGKDSSSSRTERRDRVSAAKDRSGDDDGAPRRRQSSQRGGRGGGGGRGGRGGREGGREDGARRPRGRGGRAAEGSRDAEREADDRPTTPVAGTLEVMPQRYGFVRLEGIEPGNEDVYVSASQIRRCELRPGDRIEGPARQPRRGERHPALVRVERINGAEVEAEAEAVAERPEFDALTPIAASRPLGLSGLSGDAGSSLAELAFGSRALVVGEPDAVRGGLLRELVAAAPEGVETLVLLVDERPEAVTEWRREVPDVEIVALTADRRPSEQARMARLTLHRAKRQVEAGADVLLVVDSLSRLGLAYRDPADVKTFFGAGRELEEEGAGSLTIVATLLVETGAQSDEQVYDAVITTENLLVRL